jgi:DNA-binding HxlR family transcriptional regulator
MTKLEAFCLAQLEKKVMSTRALTVAARRTLGAKVSNTMHAMPTPVNYAAIEVALRSLERDGLVLRRGHPPEWKARG